MKISSLAGLSVLLCAHAAAADGACEITDALSVLNCAVMQNVDVLTAKADVGIGRLNKEQAERLFFPTMEITGGYANGTDDRGFKAELAVMQTFDTPAARKAKIDGAAAEVRLSEARETAQKQRVALQVLSLLNRLRQIGRETDVLSESAAAYAKVIAKYNQKSALSYEDGISLELFKMALDNQKIEINRLNGEQDGAFAELQSFLNQKIAPSKTLFLHAPKAWKTVDSDAESFENGAEIQESKAVLAKAKASYAESKTANFGSFGIGPYLSSQAGNLGKLDEAGIKLSFPLPVYPNNKASAAGRIAFQSAQNKLEADKRRAAFEYEALSKRYRQGVETLKGIDIASVEKRHAQTEKLFATGRVGASVLIEAHRQIAEAVQSYHQYELETLESLWRLYVLQGKLLSNLTEVADVQ